MSEGPVIICESGLNGVNIALQNFVPCRDLTAFVRKCEGLARKCEGLA